MGRMGGGFPHMRCINAAGKTPKAALKRSTKDCGQSCKLSQSPGPLPLPRHSRSMNSCSTSNRSRERDRDDLVEVITIVYIVGHFNHPARRRQCRSRSHCDRHGLEAKIATDFFGFQYHGWLFLIPEPRLTGLCFAIQAPRFTRFGLMALATAQEFLPPRL